MFPEMKIESKRRIFLSALFSAVLVVTAILTIFSMNSYPVLDGDASCFMPCAVNYASGHGLINTIWAPNHVYNPSHPEWLTWHGFAFSMLTSAISPNSSYLGTRISMLIMQLVILFSMMFILLRISKNNYNFKIWVSQIAALFATISYCSITGRPELLVSMWISLGILLSIYLPTYRWWVIGATIGLVAITSPIPAFFLGLLLMVYISKNDNIRIIIYKLLQVASTCIFAIFLGFMFYPYGFSAWIQGVKLHSAVAFGGWGFDKLIYYWMLAPNSILFGFLFLATCVMFYFYWNKYSKIKKIISAFFLAILAFSFYKFVGNAPARIYNITALSTLFIVFSFKQSLSDGKLKYKLLFSTSIFVLCSLGFVRSILIFPAFNEHGLSYKDANTQFNQFLEQSAKKNEKIGVSTGLFTLVPFSKNIEIIRDESNITTKYDYLIIQQVNRGKLNPDSIPYYKLVSNNFSSYIPQIHGKRIANTSGGYNFAIYKHISH